MLDWDVSDRVEAESLNLTLLGVRMLDGDVSDRV